MSDPIDTTKVKPLQALQSAASELLSAESSLHMPPESIPADERRPRSTGRPEFLSESDANVAHAIEHVHAAFRLVNMAQHDQDSLKTQIYRLVVQLREAGMAPCVRTWLDEDD